MNTITKASIRPGLFSGLAYAILLAGDDYWSNGNFNTGKFLLRFLVFGLLTTLIIRYHLKKTKPLENL